MFGDVGGSLVWLLILNLLFYGDIMDIVIVKVEGVNIMIGFDWGLLGFKSLMYELKIVDWWDDNVFGDVFIDYELV